MKGRGDSNFGAGMLLAALMAAGVLSVFASPEPDGLERVGEDLGFLSRAEGQEKISSLFPDYEIPGLPGGIAGPAAGIVGVSCTFMVGNAIAHLLKEEREVAAD